jgi:hypothetical protein
MLLRVWKIFLRILLEFGPPVIFAATWIWWTSNPPPEWWRPYLKELGLTFVASSWVWAQLLRIVYQQNQSQRLTIMARDLDEIKTTIRMAQSIIRIIITRFTSEEILLLKGLLERARRQIDRATRDLPVRPVLLLPRPRPRADPETPESPPSP